MPKKQHTEKGCEVVSASFDFIKGRPIKLPGAPGFAVPRQFSAWVADLDRDVLVGMAVATDEDRPSIAEVTVEGRALSPSELRDLPYGSYLDAALAKVMLKADRLPTSEPNFRLTPLNDRGEIRRALTAHKSSRRNARRAVTTDRLERVAAYYREALEKQVPTGKYIADRELVSKGTARSLVARARAAGLLGAATGRKAGEG